MPVVKRHPVRLRPRSRFCFGAARPGHQILLKPGTTLAVNIPLRIERSGTEGKPITLERMATVMLHDQSMRRGSVVGHGDRLREQGYWVVQYLHFKGTKVPSTMPVVIIRRPARHGDWLCPECIHAGRSSPTTFSAHITIKEILSMHLIEQRVST